MGKKKKPLDLPNLKVSVGLYKTRKPSQRGSRTNDLYCHGQKMQFDGYRVKGRGGKKRPVNQIVYLCKICGHHKWVNKKGKIPKRFVSPKYKGGEIDVVEGGITHQ